MLGITSHPVPSIEFIMTRFPTRKKSKESWYSPPFYTGPGGYKMCLRVDVSCVIGRVVSGRDLFACVCLVRGEYDST